MSTRDSSDGQGRATRSRAHRSTERPRQPEGEVASPRASSADHVAYLAEVHLGHLSHLADQLVQAIDDHHETRDMLPDTEQVRGELIETLDRLDEARRRGPGQP